MGKNLGIYGGAGYVLIGAGGHARGVVEAADKILGEIKFYIDSQRCPWLQCGQIESDTEEFDKKIPIVIGLGGVQVKQLKKRLDILQTFLSKGYTAPPIIHSKAIVSDTANIGLGVVILAGAIIQPGVKVGKGTIINSGSIVEHDCSIGEGVHVAPGAVILGQSIIGDCSMIGASSVTLPRSKIDDDSLIPALTRYPHKK